MKDAWKFVHMYAFQDLIDQLKFLLVTALPQLIAQNDSLPFYEKRFLQEKLDGAKTKLNITINRYKIKSSEQFVENKSTGKRKVIKPSYVIMDYLSDVSEKYQAFDWYRFSEKSISDIEQVSQSLRSFMKLVGLNKYQLEWFNNNIAVSTTVHHSISASAMLIAEDILFFIIANTYICFRFQTDLLQCFRSIFFREKKVEAAFITRLAK